MADEYLKAVIKSNVMDHLGGDGNRGAGSTASMYSSNSSYDGEYEADELRHTMGLRSPGGPLRGRSVKEFEEQLSNLKKENFNLKLRIYFLEEKMGTHFTLDKDNVVKKYIELQVEYSNLQKEVQEKHELLCQAVKAMEMEDEEHKKYVANKEDQLNMCQQELEDLRMQLQDSKFDSDGLSLKSDTTGFYSSRATNSGSLVPELQEKIKMLETELQLEKENNASLQFIIGQAETLKSRYECAQRECAVKDETIRNLHDELEVANKRIMECSCQIKEAQEKLENAFRDNQSLHKRIVSENRKFEELALQLNDFKKKYANSRADLEREHKRSERLKASSDAKTSELEKESDKQKAKIRDLQAKLETALVEIKKNQNLAVSKSPALASATSNTDSVRFSVPDAAAPAGAAQADALHVQVAQTTPEGASAPPSPDAVSWASGSLEEGATTDADEILRRFRELRGEYEAQKQRLVKVKKEQFKACEIIKSMIDSRNQANTEIAELRKKVEEADALRKHVAQLEHELESVVTKPEEGSLLRRRVADMNIKAAGGGGGGGAPAVEEKPMAEPQTEDLEIAEHYKALTVELEAKIEILVETLNEKDAQMQKIRQQYDEILTSLEEKENKLVSMQSEQKSSSDQEDDDNEDFPPEKTDAPQKHSSFYRHEMAEKDREIERLNGELKKCTCYLQEIVNKELWDKNKEIEKLHSKQANSSFKKELAGKEEQIETLKATVEELKAELEACERLRSESNEVCSLLNARLEELALFLDSLLKQKSVLGFLGLHKERKLRVLVNNSLDLSKSFAMSMIINPDQSLAQLSNITAMLNGSAFQEVTFNGTQPEEESQEMLAIIPKDVTLTYQSHLYKQAKNSSPNDEDLIAALRQQIVNLKSELQLRDIELSKMNANLCTKTSDSEVDLRQKTGFRDISKLFLSPVKCNTTSTTLKYQTECQSESEGWSEPDRTVSRARIGLSQTLPNFVSVRNELSESTEEELAYPLTPTKKGSEGKQRIVELEEELERKKSELEAAESKMADAVGVEELKGRLAEAEARLSNAELRKEEAESKLKQLEETVRELSKDKETLQELMTVKDKEAQNAVNRLQVEKDEASRKCLEMEREAAEAKMEVERTRVELQELEVNLRSEFESMAEGKLREAEDEFLERLKLSEERYLRDYVRKSEVESRLAQVEALIVELDELKVAVKSYEETVLAYKEKEKGMGDKLDESQEKVNCLRKELDQVTLQYSQAVLEKTKLANEKTALEQEMSRNSVASMELRQQISDIRTEFDSVGQAYQQQVSALQKQKSSLEVKLSEVESNNAELHNRLVKLQACRGDMNASLPAFATVDRQMAPYYRSAQMTESLERNFSNANYSSEENAEEATARPFATRRGGLRPTEVERLEANSSPDLGIESDHGRFSSLETTTTTTTATANAGVIRPLKQTIELTESMSNLLDGDNNPVEGVGCDGELCCRRTMEIAHENNDLKRKLLRMRRALEETAAQLSLANQRKKQVEKTICKQIQKTSQVLRKVKANLDSGSESDVLKRT